MKRRLFLALIMVAPTATAWIGRRTDFFREYRQVDGWILKSDDI